MFENWQLSLATFLPVLVLLYLYIKRCHRYWTDRGAPSLKPHLIFGNVADIVLGGASEIEHWDKMYKEMGQHKYVGYYRFHRPGLVVRDPELIKHIFTKDFSHFPDRNKEFVIEKDVLSHHLFNLTGEKWKHLRVKLSPTFTSGKMKQLFPLMVECANALSDVVEEMIQKNPELEMKEMLARYSTDVISSCAFGLQANTLRNGDNDFRKMGKKIFELDFRRKVFVMLILISPKLIKYFGLSFTPPDVRNFFVDLVSSTVKYRETNGVVRNDFINLMMELRNESSSKTESNGTQSKMVSKDDGKIELTLEMMTAQSFIFYVAGFETSSGILSCCLLELARHPDIQQKLRDEIKATLATSGGEITYEMIHKMPYMEKVVSEAMRKYPSLPVLFRQCTKDYRIPGTEIIIEKGTEVFVPVYGIHHDPNHYPNPTEFDPENFSEENKSKRHNYTFLPFGEGPRICIGMRFGQMQVKLALLVLINRFKFEVAPRMQYPVKFKTKSLVTNVEGGIWLTCTKC